MCEKKNVTVCRTKTYGKMLFSKKKGIFLFLQNAVIFFCKINKNEEMVGQGYLVESENRSNLPPP